MKHVKHLKQLPKNLVKYGILRLELLNKIGTKYKEDFDVFVSSRVYHFAISDPGKVCFYLSDPKKLLRDEYFSRFKAMQKNRVNYSSYWTLEDEEIQRIKR